MRGNDYSGVGAARRNPRGGVPALRQGSEVAPRTLRAQLSANLLLEEVPQAPRECVQHPLPRLEVERDVRGVESWSGPRRPGWAPPSSAQGGAGRCLE